MNRVQLIQDIFSKTDFTTYLEIGCRGGHSFLPIKAKYKTAVDPEFIIPRKRKLKWVVKNSVNINNKYFELTSDDFFAQQSAYLKKLEKLDVVLVDGLHTFRAALLDVLNSLKYLNQNGIIIMHDCLPPHKAASIPTKDFPEGEERNIEGWTGEWCGDVWKSIVYLQKKYGKDLDVCVLNTDYGLGIVQPNVTLNESALKIDEQLFEKIDRLSYEDLMADTAIINLQAAAAHSKIVERML